MYDAVEDPYCYPENIAAEMKKLFADLRRKRYLRDRSRGEFAKRAGHPLDLDRLKPDEFLAAMIASFKGDDTLLERQILLLAG